jgi:hypothetical protein
MMKNPVLMLVIGLPLVAVLGSFASLAVTLAHEDPPLPEQYHWEGFQLDRDFSRSERAASLGVQATLRNVAATGECEVELTVAGPAPEQLMLTLAHATRAGLDQNIVFHRTADGRTYVGHCRAIPEGHWRIELTDDAQTWSVRDSTRTISLPVRIDATTADDD